MLCWKAAHRSAISRPDRSEPSERMLPSDFQSCRRNILQDWVDVQEFYGCGKFVSDSWRIFCRGELALQVSGPRRVLERPLSG